MTELAYSPAFQAVLDADPQRGLEPRAGDQWGGRRVMRTFFSPFARMRFVVYRTACGRNSSISIERWRRWAGRV